MHELSLPADLVARVIERAGRPHPFDAIEPANTAFVVVDMQNYFMKPGFQGEVPKARAIVPAVNRLAAALRALGEHATPTRSTTRRCAPSIPSSATCRRWTRCLHPSNAASPRPRPDTFGCAAFRSDP